LSDRETEELRSGAPTLAPLLAINIPHDRSHGLFRLSRLASRSSDAPMPRTEAEMADNGGNPPMDRKTAATGSALGFSRRSPRRRLTVPRS